MLARWLNLRNCPETAAYARESKRARQEAVNVHQNIFSALVGCVISVSSFLGVARAQAAAPRRSSSWENSGDGGPSTLSRAGREVRE